MGGLQPLGASIYFLRCRPRSEVIVSGSGTGEHDGGRLAMSGTMTQPMLLGLGYNGMSYEYVSQKIIDTYIIDFVSRHSTAIPAPPGFGDSNDLHIGEGSITESASALLLIFAIPK